MWWAPYCCVTWSAIAILSITSLYHRKNYNFGTIQSAMWSLALLSHCLCLREMFSKAKNVFGQPSCRNRLCLVKMSQLWNEQQKDQHKRFFFPPKKKVQVLLWKYLQNNWKYSFKNLKILLKMEPFVAVKRCSRVAGNKAAEWMASRVCACTLPAPPRRRQPGPAFLRTPSGPLCLPYQPESKAHNPTVCLPPTEPLSILPH